MRALASAVGSGGGIGSASTVPTAGCAASSTTPGSARPAGSTRNLLAGGADVHRRDFIARAELLAPGGMTTLITDYFDYCRLAAYIAERTRERIGIVMGVSSLTPIWLPNTGRRNGQKRRPPDSW